jgi:cytochrome c553
MTVTVPVRVVLMLLTVGAGADSLIAQSAADRVEQCGTCHGKDGNSAIERVPSLAGQPEFFLTNQLVLFREGVRAIEPMASLVKDLKDDDIVALAQHFAKLPPKRTSEAVDAALAKKGAEVAQKLHCGSCHTPTLAGDEQMPRLAGQRIDYMVMALRSYRDSTRSGPDPLMNEVVAGVDDGDLIALAHYAASR